MNEPTTAHARRFSPRVPRPLWAVLTTIAIVLCAVALRIGLLTYWQRNTIRQIERHQAEHREWSYRHPYFSEIDLLLLDWVGKDWVQAFQQVEAVSLEPAFLREGYGAVDSDVVSLELHKLTGIMELSLSHTQVSDATLEYIRGMGSLQSIGLNGTQISDAGLPALASLSRLEYVDLFGTSITDAGVVHLGNLKRLEYLDLGSTGITDSSLAHLQTLDRLQWLDVRDTKISDAGLQSLKHLTKLKDLDLRRTKVTATGVRELSDALPDTKIRRDLH